MSPALTQPLRSGKSRGANQSAYTNRAAASVIESLERRLFLASTQINPGFAMGAMQADPLRDLVYMLDQTDKRVIAIDTGLARTASFADVGGNGPTSLAISPDDKELYVAASGDNRIEVYSLPELFPLRTLDVSTPGRLAVGAGNRLYVTGNSTWAGMRQVDSITGNVLRTFGSFYSPLPVTDSTGTRLFISELYLSTTGTDEYNIADPKKAPVSVKHWDTNMANGYDFAIDEQYNRLYSMSGGVYGVWVVDQANGNGKIWSFGGAAYGGRVSVTADQPYVWATSQDPYGGGVFKFDRASGAVVARYATTHGYSAAVDVEATPNGRVLYTADPGYNQLGTELGIIGSSTLTVTGVPMARFNSEVDPFPSLKVSFDATPSRDWDAKGFITNWAWNFGDGTTGAGAKINHTFTSLRKYTVTLTVTDNEGNKDDYVLTLNLSNPPLAQPQSLTLNEDSSITFSLQGSDPDGDPISFIVKTPPAHGKIEQSGASVTYTPQGDFFGSDTLVFAASDGAHESAPATVSFTVKNLPDAPVANDDALPIAAGPQTLILPLLNDIDVDGERLSITSFTQPGAGSVVRSGDYFLYTPALPGSSTADSFSYTVSDPSGLSSTATVYIAPGYARLSGEWTTYGDSAAHAGYFAGTVGNAFPVPAWSLPAESTNSRPIAVGGGRVYVTDWQPDGYFLKALSPSTGATLWSHRFESANSLNPPTYFNGIVYLQRGNHGSDTQLWAIDAATGATVWSEPFSAQWENYYAPAVSSQGVWINGGYYGGMYGFKLDGTPITFVSLAQYDEWTPSILGTNVYSYVAGVFTKYDMSGNYIWANSKSWDWAGWSMERTAALVDGQAFLVGNPDLYRVDLTTGDTEWTVPGNFTGTPAANAGVVFALQGSEVKSYSASTGAALRTYTADQNLREQPIITDDAVIAASYETTYIFSRSSGALLHTLPFGGTIALSNNRLYISSNGGSIHTFIFAAQTPLPLVAGGPYTVAEGGTLTLSPLVTPPAGISVTSYDIDWDYDGVTFNAEATSISSLFSTAGLAPGAHMIALRAHFSTGDFSNISAASLTIVDAAPTATFSAPSAVNEGSSASIEFTHPSGPAGGFVYSYDFDSDGTFEIVKSSSPTAAVPSNLLNDGPRQLTVTARIYDQNDRFTQYQKTININNVAPTATLGNGGAVDEGSTATVSFSGASDPSTADTAAGFRYSFDFDNDGIFEMSKSSLGSATVPASYLQEGPGSRTVRGRIADKDGGFTDYQTTITIKNVAPTASLSNSGPVNEGASTATVSFSNQSDASPIDAAAGFTYSYDFNSDGIFEIVSSTSPTVTVPAIYLTDGPSSRLITATITDKDGASRTYTTPLLVRNVAPTAVLSSGGPINEMSPGILRFTSIFDPSAADTAAGFGFSYDLNNDGDYRDAGEAENVLASKWNYTFPDNGTYIVAARITDRDGGSSVYTTAVIVNNVPPTASISLLDDKANHGKKPLHRKKVSTFSLAAIDVSPIDQKSPFKFSIDWDGDGKIDEILTSSSSNLTVNHVFGHKGDFTIKAFATDKDGQMGPAALLTVRVV